MSNIPADANTLPKATMDQMLKEIIASDVTITGAAKDIVHQCAVKFINMIAAEANEIALLSGKTQIGGEHIIKALKDLGLDDFVDSINEVGQQFQQKGKAAFKVKKLKQVAALACEHLHKEQETFVGESLARIKGVEDPAA